MPPSHRLTRAVLAALLLALTLPAVPVLAEDPVPPPPSRLGSPEIFGYLPYWDLDAQIDYGAITTIAYFGLGAGADGRLIRTTANGSATTEYSRWRSAKVDSIIQQAHAQGVKFVLTVERMAWEDGTKATTRALLNSPEARTTLVNEIVAEIVARGLDGVTLDFEPILSDTRDQFAALLAELRAGLDAVNPAYQLTFASTGSAPALTYQMYGNVTAAGWADAVLIMAYPLRAIDARIAGGLAPLYSASSYDLKQITNAYLQYVAPDKLVMLLPWYGRQWPTVTAELNSRVQEDRALYDRPRNISYANAIPHAIKNGRNLDPVEMSAWTAFRWRYCADCPETWKQVYYEDVETLAYKYDWSLNQGMAGIGIWSLGMDNDRPELWKLLRVKYRGLVDIAPPNGTLALAAGEQLCTAYTARLTLGADDGVDGSGAVFVRVSSSDAIGTDGLLSQSRTYPAAPEISWPLNDPLLGGSDATGPRTVFAQWRDVAGNWSPVTSTSLDLTLPGTATLSLAGGAPWVSTPAVDLLVSQTGGRPISRVLVSNSPTTNLDGLLSQAVDMPLGTATPLSLIDGATGGIDADGVHDVWVQWQDSAGCWSAPVSASTALDRVAPVGSLSLVGAPTLSLDGQVQVLAPASDEASGMQRLELSNDGLTWLAFDPSADPIAWSAADTPDGAWTIRARWSDVAGNVSAEQSVALLLDRNAPVGTLLINNGATTTTSDLVSVTAPAVDEASSVDTVRLSSSPDVLDGLLVNGTDFAPGAPIDWMINGEGDGVRHVYAQWRDSVGHWSGVSAAQIVLDRAAPTVSAPQTTLVSGSQIGQTSVPLGVEWAASDDLSGVAGSQLELARDADPWQGVGQGLTSSSASVVIDRSATWRLRVSATDGAGNLSLPAEAAPTAARVSEDSAATLVYGGAWTRVRRSSASGGSIRYATTKGATASLTFTGRSIAWVAPVGAKLGRARVIIDGRAVTTVDLGATTPQQRLLVFTRNWAQAGTHTIKIRVMGTAGRPRVELDGFVVLN